MIHQPSTCEIRWEPWNDKCTEPSFGLLECFLSIPGSDTISADAIDHLALGALWVCEHHYNRAERCIRKLDQLGMLSQLEDGEMVTKVWPNITER